MNFSDPLVDVEEVRRRLALSREQGWPMGGPRDPFGWQRDALSEHDIRSGMVPDPQLPAFGMGGPSGMLSDTNDQTASIVPVPSIDWSMGAKHDTVIPTPAPTRTFTQTELDSKREQDRFWNSQKTPQPPGGEKALLQDSIARKKVRSASDLQSGVATGTGGFAQEPYEDRKFGYNSVVADPDNLIPPLRTPGLAERLQSLPGGMRDWTSDFLKDPQRVALVQAGLTAMDPQSYYGPEGFHSTWGGLNKALMGGVKTYKELSKPKELSFKEQQKVKHEYDIKLEKEKAKSKKPPSVSTKLDANKRLRYVDGPNAGELVYKNITVEPEAIKKMDESQIFNSEDKLRSQFNNATKIPRAQVDAYRRIESIFDDPMIDNPIGNNSMVSDADGTVNLRGFIKEDGSFFELDQGGAADLALIFNFMKMLDPQSVVRESEFALAGQTGGMKESIKAGWQKLMEGGRLSTKMRRNLMRQSRVQFNSADREVAKVLEEYTNLAKRYESMGVKSDRLYAWKRYDPTLPFSVFGKPAGEGGPPPIDPNDPADIGAILKKNKK